MAIAVEMNFTGATTDQYDRILQKMSLTPNGATPPGAIRIWVAKTEDGMRVVDVWESREVFDRYSQEKIGPYSRDVGIESEPEVRMYEVQ